MSNLKLSSIHWKLFLLPFLVGSVFVSADLYGQDEKLLNTKQLTKDFNQLLEILEAHPDPYTHISEDDFNQKAEEIRNSFDKPHSLVEFYKKTSSLVATIKDGHSSMYMPNQWFQRIQKKRGALPFKVYLTNNNKLYLIKKFQEINIPVGAEITAINNISVDSFISIIDPFISYELPQFRNTLIDDSFDFFLYLAFGDQDIILDYFSSHTAQYRVEYMPYEKKKKYFKDNRADREKLIAKGQPYSYEKVSDGIGLIKVFSFSTSSMKTYNFFLRNTFKQIKKDSIHSLIIDVRGNYGGWPKVASRLFHYITDKHFKTMALSRMKVSRAYRDKMYQSMPFLRDKSNNIIIHKERHFVNIEAIVNKKIGSFVDESTFYNEEPIEETFEYNGDCYLLINRDCFSAASSFASTFQCYQLGHIIGEETGGTKIFRAHAIYNSLNKSRLTIGISTTKLFTACFLEEKESIKPTIPFSPSIIDLSNEFDSQLLYTQRIIKRKRTQ